MNAQTFGKNDGKAEFLSRYGVSSYHELGQKMHDAQIRAAEQARPQDVIRPRKPTYVASPRAIDYLADLAMENPQTLKQGMTREDIVAWAKTVEAHVVSEKIDELKGTAKSDFTPVQDRLPLERHGVPAGRYAITANEGHTTFLRVEIPKEGKWAGRIYVQVQASDTLHRTSRDMADTFLARIAEAGPQKASLRYGRELGQCGVCGRTLTNEASRERGIGPDCASKMGW